MKSFNLLEYDRFYFCGICGVGMSSLAKHLISLGKTVHGSDKQNGETALELKSFGIKVSCQKDISHIVEFCPQVFVYSSAIDQGNQEFAYAKNVGIRIIKRSELLGAIMNEFAKRIAISGCHGKTTATAMLSKVLIDCELDPTVFLGGEDYSFSNYRKGSNKLVVAEVCEYKKNLLDVNADISVVLNLDNDHLDSYKDMNDLVGTFEEFIKNSIAVVNSDDRLLLKSSHQSTVTFGVNNNATYTARKVKYNGKGYSFTVYRNNIKQTQINLEIKGEHNVYNALACYVVCDLLGVSKRAIKTSLEKFKGVKRRMERIGELDGVDYVCDYAHHPSEISAVLKTLAIDRKKDLIVFQPHTYSRTQSLFSEFVNVLSDVNKLILYKTFPARERYIKNGSSYSLYLELKAKGKKEVYHAGCSTVLKGLVKGLSFDVERVIFLGAGDIYHIAKELICIK